MSRVLRTITIPDLPSYQALMRELREKYKASRHNGAYHSAFIRWNRAGRLVPASSPDLEVEALEIQFHIAPPRNGLKRRKQS